MKKLICLILVMTLLLAGCGSPEEQKFNALINTLLSSEVYENWLWVAECEDANPVQLATCASQCAGIGKWKNETYDSDESFKLACEIATSLVSHPNSTEYVVRKLMHAHYYEVWAIAASAECNTEAMLVEMAMMCAKITDANSSGPASDSATRIATNIVNNSNSTESVYLELLKSCYPEVRELAFQALGYGESIERLPNLE